MKTFTKLISGIIALVIMIVRLPIIVANEFLKSLIAICTGNIENYFKVKDIFCRMKVDAAKRTRRGEDVTLLTKLEYTQSDGKILTVKTGIENGKPVTEITEETVGK